MTVPRRQFLQLAAGAAALPVLTRIARAQAYPTRAVRILVGFAAGGGTDIVARLTGQWLSERLGQQFIIENRPGAATNIATEAVVRSPADGYTLLLATPANAINATLYDKLRFNFIRDTVPIGGIMRVPNVMAVNPSVPAETVPDFIAYAKASPGAINYAFAGGSVQMSAELFKMMTGINMIGVPYRGAALALTDLIAGRVQVMFANLPSSIEQIRAGKLRALAVTTWTRSEALPEIPTVDSFVPGYEVSAFFGLSAPRNTPAEIVAKLNNEINSALADDKFKVRLTELNGMTLGGSRFEFGSLIAYETGRWGNVIRAANIKPE